jgi:Skp family chaperone for outer membrane proteins
VRIWLLVSIFSVAGCGLLAILPCASGQTAASPVSGARPALKIAVVDMGQVLQQYKQASYVRDEVKAAGEAKNAKLQEMVGKGQELIKSLKEAALDPDSTEFRERETKIFQIESYAKAYKSSAEKELQRENMKASLAVYNEIHEALRVFSQQNGFAAILRVDNEARSLTDPTSAGRVLSQDVIYYRARDITNPVVVYLNNKYDSPDANKARKGRKVNGDK